MPIMIQSGYTPAMESLCPRNYFCFVLQITSFQPHLFFLLKCCPWVFLYVYQLVLTTTGLSALMLCFNYLLQVPYPNNLLRNVGRSILPPEAYILVVDVDMMCNGDLYSSFLEYAQHINLMVNKGIEKRFYLFVMRM